MSTSAAHEVILITCQYESISVVCPRWRLS